VQGYERVSPGEVQQSNSSPDWDTVFRGDGRFNDLINKQILLITGKGGVGRSTVCAFLAEKAIQMGKRVLVAEFPQGESDGEAGAQRFSPLARLMGRERFESEPRILPNGVVAAELSARVGQLGFLSVVMRSERLAKAAMGAEVIQRLIDVAPTLREMGLFYHFLELYKNFIVKNRADLMILDLPATGHAVGLTQLPHAFLRLMPSGKISDVVREGQRALYDPIHSGALVVTLPELLPLTEAEELAEQLQKEGLTVLGRLVNRVPAEKWTSDELDWVEKAGLTSPAISGALEFMRQRRAYHVLKDQLGQRRTWMLREKTGNSREVLAHLLKEEGV
jgi:arsenite-transporting ATPase